MAQCTPEALWTSRRLDMLMRRLIFETAGGLPGRLSVCRRTRRRRRDPPPGGATRGRKLAMTPRQTVYGFVGRQRKEIVPCSDGFFFLLFGVFAATPHVVSPSVNPEAVKK